MATTPTLGLTLMSASQAQKEVVFNEALLAFDSLFWGVVLSAALSTPPASPNEGDTYIIAGGASGAWSAQDHNIAFYFNGWQFVTAKNQMRLYDQAANVWRVYRASTTSWDAEPASTVSVLTDLTNVQGMPTNGQVLTFVAVDGKWEPKNPVFTAALNTLTDVNVTEGGSIDGYALMWNNTDHKWEAGAVLTAKPAALSLPDVTIPTGVRDGWFAVYNATGPGVKFVDPTTVTIARSLQNVGDVAYPTGGSGAIASGAYLQWNGAAWAPSTSAVSISVQSLSNGPGSFSGNASKLLRVDSTESKLEYTTLALSTLPDVNVSEGAGIDGYTLVWSNATSKWVAAAHSSASLAGLTDVQITEGAGIDGQVLYWKNADSKWESKALAPVAVSGAYGDLSGKPSLATVALSGAYADLAAKPSLATVATSGAYDDLSGKPSLATVATSGAYGDLTGKPTNGSWSLAGLADVSMSPGSGNDGYVVYWDNATTRFKLKAVSGGSSSLATLTDVSVTESSGIDGYVLKWNNSTSKWIASASGGASALSGLSDVNVIEGSGIDGKYLKWDNGAGKWVADAPSGGGGGSSTLAGDTDVSISSPSNNQQLTYDSTAGVWKNKPAAFYIAVSVTGVMTNGEMLLQYVMPCVVNIAAGAPGSYAKANTACALATTISIRKNGAAVGTIAFPASGTTGTFTFATAQTFSAGDVLQLMAPSTADSTLADIGITLYGTKG